MPEKIFISYRRDDDPSAAARVRDGLVPKFGKDSVFMDVDNLHPGQRFDEELDKALANCDVFIAVIGTRWMELLIGRGNGSERDYVRKEIAAALKRRIKLIPVRVGRQEKLLQLPRSEELPIDIRDLVRHQKHDVAHETFGRDIAELIEAIKRKGGRDEGPETVIVEVGPPEKAETKFLSPGAGNTQWFKDHEHGPEMVVVPAGSFMMGSPNSEPERSRAEDPQHKVTFALPFAVSRKTITRGEFGTFVSSTSYDMSGEAFSWKGWLWKVWKHDPRVSWRDPGFLQDDGHPVVCVNWNDACAYIAWLARITGKPYRLLSETEREYVTRAGTTTPFWWGYDITSVQANYRSSGRPYKGGGAKGAWRRGTVSASNFTTNQWGLFNVHGNVWDWCEDTWHRNYSGAPTDGSAWTHGGRYRVVRGGAWDDKPRELRSANRSCSITGIRGYGLSFRVARGLA